MENLFIEENIESSKRIIYTPSSFARNNLLHLQETGQLQVHTPHTSRRENLVSYLFFIVEKGNGQLEYDHHVYTLHTGDCVFIDCRKPYAHRSGENLWTLRWVHFHGPNINEIYEQYKEREGQPCFHTSHFHEYVSLLQKLYELANSQNTIRDMKICENLTSLLTLLMEDSMIPSKNTHSSSLKKELHQIKKYLDEHYQEKITLDQLAEQFFINKFYLTRIFREHFGTTINHYLLSIRITHAKKLLRFTDLPIEKIAYECGMRDGNYFARMFRKTEGMPPGEFRKRW